MSPPAAKAGAGAALLTAWAQIARPWFTGGASKWSAIGYTACCYALALVSTLVSVRISFAQRRFSTALAEKDPANFWRAIREFIGIIFVAAPVNALDPFLSERMIVRWREHLTGSMLRSYLGPGRPYYHLKPSGPASADDGAAAAPDGAAIDNPDQRISEDVKNFVKSSVTVNLLLAKKVLNCVAFAGVLWSISPKLVLFLLSYAAVGTAITTCCFGRLLMRLQYALLSREGDMRFLLIRVRENAESIAFYRAEGQELSALLSALLRVVRVSLTRVRVMGAYELFVNFYNYISIIEYFAGRVEFGVLSQASFAFSVIKEALNVLINRLDTLSQLAAETQRLWALASQLAASGAEAADGGGGKGGAGGGAAPGAAAAAGAKERDARRRRRGKGARGGGGGAAYARIDSDGSGSGSEAGGGGGGAAEPNGAAAEPGAAPAAGGGGAGAGGRVLRLVSAPDDGLSVRGLRVAVPGGGRRQLVADGLDLELRPGDSVLIVGPSGCGKSSLLRVLAGLWTRGAGTVAAPAPQHCFFLPQRPYMPIGSLRTQLTFPGFCDPAGAGGAMCDGGADDLKALGGLLAPGDAPPRGRRRSSSDGGGGGGNGGEGSVQWGAVRVEMLPLLRRAPRAPGVPDAGAPEGRSAEAGCGGDAGGEGSGSEGGGRDAGAAAGPGSISGGAARALGVVSDAELLELLEEVQLGDLAARVGGLGAERDWSQMLSLGEQQRVAFARLLLHAPALAALDEATSALDAATEARLYRLLRARLGAGSVVVSVGHRPALAGHHARVLAAAGGGRWEAMAVGEYAAREAGGGGG